MAAATGVSIVANASRPQGNPPNGTRDRAAPRPPPTRWRPTPARPGSRSHQHGRHAGDAVEDRLEQGQRDPGVGADHLQPRSSTSMNTAPNASPPRTRGPGSCPAPRVSARPPPAAAGGPVEGLEGDAGRPDTRARASRAAARSPGSFVVRTGVTTYQSTGCGREKRPETLRTDSAPAGCASRGRCLLGTGLFSCPTPRRDADLREPRRPVLVVPDPRRGHLDVSLPLRPAWWTSGRLPAGRWLCQQPADQGVWANSQVSEGDPVTRFRHTILPCPACRATTRRCWSSGLRRDHDHAGRGGRHDRGIEHLRAELGASGAAPPRPRPHGTPGCASADPTGTTSAVISRTSPARTGARNCTSE